MLSEMHHPTLIVVYGSKVAVACTRTPAMVRSSSSPDCEIISEMIPANM
jgi:hypothetical protein